MLRVAKPDIVDLIVPPHAQARAIRICLAAGVQAIICQKPFCQDVDEAITLTQEARAAGIPLIIHENFRWQPWYRTLKAALDARRIGALHQITFRLRTGDG
jgi:D-apiose dehydrogenase